MERLWFSGDSPTDLKHSKSCLTADSDVPPLTTIVVLQGGGYGGGYGGGHGGGTACIVKGSYCQCHYCKCEKGHVSCKGYGHDKGYGNKMLFKIILRIIRIL